MAVARRARVAGPGCTHAVEDSVDRVYADIRLGMGLQGGGAPPGTGHPFLRRAMERARHMDDPRAFFLAAAYALRYLLAVRDRPMLHTLADEALGRSRAGAGSGDVGLCLKQVGGVLLERGERERAEHAWRELAELAERTHDATLLVMAMELVGPARRAGRTHRRSADGQ